MSDPGRVLVVGGGMAGLSAGIALRRSGREVDVVEANPRWDVYGVGIIQPGNALRALDELGLADAVVEQGWPMLGTRMHDADGHVLVDMDFDRAADDRLPPQNGITRPRLHALLSEAVVAAGADVRTGVSTTELHDDGEGVDVAFSDGSRRRYDLVVGADGSRSSVRAELFPELGDPEPNGQWVWRYNLPRVEGLDRLWIFDAGVAKAGFVPLGPDLMYLLLIEVPPPGEPPRPAPEALADVMRARLERFGGPVAAVRDQIVDPAGVVLRPVETLLVPDPWFRGRIVLVGDAAHATSPHVGQGAAQAIEDGIVLAQELDGAGDVQDALERFMARRFERCRIVLEGSRQIGRWEVDGTPDADHVGMVMRITNAAALPI